MVRSAAWRALALLAWSSGCAPALPVQPPAAPAPVVPAPAALALASLLPAGAQRCVVTQPARIAPEKRTLYAQVSQAAPLPWSLALAPDAYGRADFEGPGGRRESVEYLRFSGAERAQIRAALAQGDSRPLLWQDAPPTPPADGERWPAACADPGCAAVGARFVDPHTVLLTTPPVPSAYPAGVGACLRLLREAPASVEVAARADALVGSARTASESFLYDSPATLTRVLRHRFQDEAAAEQALLHALSGEEDAPSLASSLVEAERRRAGEWLELRGSVSFEELALGLADQARLREALRIGGGARVAAAAPDEADADAVRVFVDARLRALASDAQQPERLQQLDDLLTRALRVHPDEEGLARRLFELRIAHRKAASAALEVADRALAEVRGEPTFWQLARRRALLALSAKRYRAELQKSLSLPARAAAQMAAEVAQKVAQGQDFERAEWAFSSARELCQRAQRGEPRQSAAAHARLPLAELPRLLVYLARLAPEREQQGFGVHILARGADQSLAGDGEQAWSEESGACGSGGRVLAAASFDDAQLLALGALLARHFPSGELSLVIAIDPLQGPGAAAGNSFRLSGQVQAGVLSLREVGRALRDVRWPLLDRYLLAPLAALRGALFPPDEWAIEASSSELAATLLASARGEPAASCAADGVVVRCRGSFADPRAAARALRRAAFAVLAKEARALWSGTD